MLGLPLKFPSAGAALGLLFGALLLGGEASAAGEDEVLVEFHYKPVPNLQIAIWLEDKDGKHVQDILVTQATGKLGIGNRPGRWDFVGSWRAPYGPRPSVLPVWAHRRGKSYPRIIFHDEDKADLESLGWHENTSSPENYYCRPLTQSEHDTISVDTKTCPSPQTFQSDKGRFDPGGATSPYPPRNDLINFEAGSDHEDATKYASMNDLDAVTAATPVGDKVEFATALLPAAVLDRAPLTAYIEVGLEHDENASYNFTREQDHFVDTRLENYGVEYLGQPSVVYKVTFDPRDKGFNGAASYAGYGDWNGATGTLHPPDATISVDAGSGADRLQTITKNGETFRWGVYSYGGDTGVPSTTDGSGGDSIGGTGEDDSSGVGPDTGEDPGDDSWGRCDQQTLPPVQGLTVEGMSFDKVRLSFTIPGDQGPDFDLTRVKVYYITGDMDFTPELLSAAVERSFSEDELGEVGAPMTVEVDQLWGDYDYRFAVVYEDKCANESSMATAAITTDAQKFQTVEGACFVATAAYGASWAAPVQALRGFRDAHLKTTPAGIDLVRFYYAYSPPLARVIQREPLLRGMARVVLQPVADAARLSTWRE